MLAFLNRNAAAIQAVGSVLAILVAIVVAWWPTHVARSDQAAARRRAARVLAMEVQPIIKAMHEDLKRALRLGWDDPDHLDTPALQARRIVGPDALEGTLARLNILDGETIRPILRMLSAIRDYHRAQSHTEMPRIVEAALTGELKRRKGWLEIACHSAAEAVERLEEAAKV
jgi:hypothetical protein